MKMVNSSFYGFGFFSPVFVMLFFFLLLDFLLVDLGLELENKSFSKSSKTIYSACIYAI